MQNDIKLVKAEDLALEIIRLHKYLSSVKKEFTISLQILRSGTSIGANIAESQYAESRSDFIHKLSISQKETNETLYWLRILHKGGYINDEIYQSLYPKTLELLKILTSAITKLKAT